MLKVNVYNQEGAVIGEEEVDSLFESIEIKMPIIHFAEKIQLANRRQGTAHTKKRGDVSGGGKKPWKQKHTGRARAGSTRSPLWRKGGVVFGPSNEINYSQKINKNMRRQAFCMILKDKIQGDRLVLIDSLNVASDLKTKNLAGLLNRLPAKDNKVFIACEAKNDALKKAGKNLSRVKISSVNALNVHDLLFYPYFLTSVAGFKKIAELYKPKIKNRKLAS
ncbi:MAG: 50S ribosomal protein L4 [Parcubacteria group bacterium]|nr:50S ribosomal protein L4 [Parcubacteria group bacterium]